MSDDSRPLVQRLRALGDEFRAQCNGAHKSMQDSGNAARRASLIYETVKWIEDHASEGKAR